MGIPEWRDWGGKIHNTRETLVNLSNGRYPNHRADFGIPTPTRHMSDTASHHTKKTRHNKHTSHIPKITHLDTDPNEQLGVGQRQLNDLPQLADLLVETANVGKGRTLARPVLGALHVKDGRIDLAGQDAHNRQRRHVERHADAGLELVPSEPSATPDDVARSAGRLDDVPLGIEPFEDVPDDLPDRLEGLQVVLGLLVPGDEALDVLPHPLEASLHLTMLTDLGPVLVEDLVAFGLLRWGRGGFGGCCRSRGRSSSSGAGVTSGGVGIGRGGGGRRGRGVVGHVILLVARGK